MMIPTCGSTASRLAARDPRVIGRLLMMNDLPEKITESIIQANEIEFAGSIAEFSIDQLLDKGILKDVPWVGWLFKATSVYSSVSDRILLAKIARFLLNLQKIKADEKRQFVKELRDDPTKKKKIGSKLLLIIDKIDDLHKTDILACVFDHYITGDITYSQFSRISHSIEQAHIEDLYSLINKDGPNHLNLLPTGLSIFKTNFVPQTNAVKIPLQLSETGNSLMLIMKNELRKENANDKERMRLLKEYFD